uniref:Uncharacterized protein n=1 Tax=Kwoniella bestiolae CBS 10118 TaxID=1296100 RepID=A0A1B9FW12_9TREE|nr:hypothetical protein I302_07308 [Kwoniella bestiolae CBS 10118]OCF22958.1 hypothetical protein I302_07308 [Kwoniella bestiolae CBS 10118]
MSYPGYGFGHRYEYYQTNEPRYTYSANTDRQSRFYTETRAPGEGYEPPRSAGSFRPPPASSSTDLRYNRRGEVDPNGKSLSEIQDEFETWLDDTYETPDRLTRDRLIASLPEWLKSGRAREMSQSQGYES